MITNERKRKILEEIIKSKNFRTELTEGEFTKAELEQEYGLARSQIDLLLKELVDSGRVTKRPALDKGKPCTAYAFTDGSELTFNS